MVDRIDVHVGRCLRRRRRLLGLSQQRLGRACGVRFQQIQKYECGENRVSAARLWRLAAALGVSVGYFFEGFGSEGAPGQIADEPAAGEPAAEEVTVEIVRLYRELDEASRRRLLELSKSLLDSRQCA